MKDTGGSAFPLVVDMNNEVTWDKGMTLRDYFAAKAMQGLCAGNSTNAQQIAEAAYIVADAMLEARKK